MQKKCHFNTHRFALLRPGKLLRALRGK